MTVKISDVRSGLNRLVNRVYRREARVIVETSGIPVAGIVSARDLERLAQLDAERAEHEQAAARECRLRKATGCSLGIASSDGDPAGEPVSRWVDRDTGQPNPAERKAVLGACLAARTER